MKSLLNLLFRKSKLPLKQNLKVTQNGDLLLFEGNLSQTAYFVEELWINPRDLDVSHGFSIATNTLKEDRFLFKVNLKKYLKKLLSFENDTFDLHLKLNVPVETLSEKQLEELEKIANFFEVKGKKWAFVRLGRFKNTQIGDLDYVEDEGIRSICYITLKGNLSILINKEPSYPVKLQIDRLKSSSKNLRLCGKVFTKGSKILSGDLIARGRDDNEEISFPVSFSLDEEMTSLKYGLKRYQYSSIINFQEKGIKSEFLKEQVYDLFLKLRLSNISEEKYVRIGRPTFRAKHFLREFYSSINNKVFILTPYYTFKLSNLSLEVFEYEKETFRYLQKMLKFAWIYRLLYKRKDIWLVGERPYKAQDTGYHFFKYMREKFPEKNVFYVVEEDSPERKNVEPFGNVLIFKSKKHILYSLVATRIIGSHHPDYLYPIRSARFKKAVKGVKVFLQHGVMGTKNMVANYGKNAPGFETDAFIVSSDFEKNMIVKDFGYNPREVYITGLSRFDSLFADDVPKKRQLLIIPTWRDWLTNDDVFMESEYFRRYHALINSPLLHSIAKENDLEIVFCLHPNMQKFTHYFQDAPVRVISQGEVDVQYLLKESALMVTDYSSVGFDFSFLHRPIIYYQFDRDRFIGSRPSHLDLDRDLPGDIVLELEQILERLEHYIQNDFTMSEENKRRANKFLKYRDRNASERIYKVVKGLKQKRRSTPIIVKDVFNHLYKRFRNSKWYFPMMKKFYSIAKVIVPIDKKLILFESGVGKQYGDSPRYIYENIIARNLDYRKVWVLNNNINFPDSNTKKIKRLSPQYYYYLARAGYWINNQNFPTYIKKRKGTTYIQTWHGTPLKKMQFDVENIQGRDEGYLQRVYQATQNWDYLISPSNYASNAFRSAFRYKGEILEIGYPRNDIFYREDKDIIARKVKRELKIPEGKKVILYAPTFRDNEHTGKNKFVFKLRMDLHELKRQLGEEYIILLRMHVVISNKLNIPDELEDFALNVSNYPDIQELCLITDILMTDYSSIMFDFANTGKPMLFFTYDLEEYKNNTRGFYMDFEEEAPGPFLFTTSDIIEAVKNIDEIKTKYRQKYKKFKEKYCSLEDGKAAERVVDRFFVNKS